MRSKTLDGASRSVNVSTSLLEYYLHDYWNENGDPRALEFPLMSSFIYNLAIVIAYYLFVLWLGPRFMHNRPAYSLKPVLIVYNLLLSVANFIFFIRGFQTEGGILILTLLFDIDYDAQETLYRHHIGDLKWVYWYLISKYLDMLDTVFFVLRKKQNQITGLHVYHHSMVPFLGWIHFRMKLVTHTGGAFALLNSPTHTLMYAYYGLAAIGPHMQPYLRWKRYLTQLQIVQFVLLFAYGMYFCTFQRGYSVWFTVDILFQSALYFILFSRFYLKAYAKGGNKPGAEATRIQNVETIKKIE